MKRNMDLIREILLKVEESSDDPMELEHCSGEEEFAYHAALLKEAGLVNAFIVKGPQGKPHSANIQSLTWAGHDFLDSARNDTVWRAAKEKVLKPGASWTFSILTELLKELAKKQIGL